MSEVSFFHTLVSCCEKKRKDFLLGKCRMTYNNDRKRVFRS